jgi:putative ABC transport system permease protein
VALGATRSRVITLIIKEGLILCMLGSALGLIGAYLIGRTMQSMLYGVGAMDFSVFSAAAFLLLIAALLACFVPARRAASADPMQALRAE